MKTEEFKKKYANATNLFTEKKYDLAYPMLKDLANVEFEGIPLKQMMCHVHFLVGLCALKSLGTQQNLLETFSSFKIASDLDCLRPCAMMKVNYVMARAYHGKLCGPRIYDIKLAVKYYEKVLNQSEVTAELKNNCCLSLGEIYNLGAGNVAKNNQKALEYYQEINIGNLNSVRQQRFVRLIVNRIKRQLDPVPQTPLNILHKKRQRSLSEGGAPLVNSKKHKEGDTDSINEAMKNLQMKPT